MKPTANIILIFLIAVISSCSIFNQKDFIEDKEIEGVISENLAVRYKLYQTGIDNFNYSFYIIQNTDTTELFTAYLNDASYKNVELEINQKEDSIRIYSNYDLGSRYKAVGKLNFKLIYNKKQKLK